MRSMFAVLALLVLSSACGGSSTAPEPLEPRRAPPAAAPAAPLEIEVASERVGKALRLDISVLGRGRDEGDAFEDPDRWSITASQNGRALSRLVNGSVEVDRLSTGTTQWDTVVKFNLVFEIADSSPVQIRLTPPGGPATERELDPGEAPEVVVDPATAADAAGDPPGAAGKDGGSAKADAASAKADAASAKADAASAKADAASAKADKPPSNDKGSTAKKNEKEKKKKQKKKAPSSDADE